ncbi:MAG: hypothetical protein IT323_02390 [Anaerolineae bacterium]|nr:hypothetical protein [Anaerolineae bacterium]
MPARKSLVLILTILLLAIVSREGRRYVVQSERVGSDIVFTAFELAGNATAWLARYDAQADSILPFYVEEGIQNQIYALRWSPDGQALAVYRFAGLSRNGEWLQSHGEVCLLSRAGEFLQCFKQKPLLRPSEGLDQLSRISWSQDEQRIIFAAEAENEANVLEADVSSGETLHVVHREPFYVQNGYVTVPSLSWTPDLRFILVNAGNPARTLLGAPQMLIDRQTGRRLDLGARLRAQADRLGSLTQICIDFSPRGTYLSLLGNGRGDTLGLADMDGQLLRVISAESGQGSLSQTSCPFWEADESGFFFAAVSSQDENAHLFHYTLADGLLEVFYRLPTVTLGTDVPWGEGRIGDMSLDPSTGFIAGVEPFAPNQSNGSTLAIVTDKGTFRRIPYPPYRVEHPIWVPSVAPGM